MVRTLIAIAATGALALPAAALASAAGDNLLVAQASGGDTGASPRQPGANAPAATSPGASSAAGATSMRGRFEALDRNSDGFVSRDEANNATELNTRFSELDTNNDNKLTLQEYEAMGAAGTGASSTSRGASGNTTSRGASGNTTSRGASGSTTGGTK